MVAATQFGIDVMGSSWDHLTIAKGGNRLRGQRRRTKWLPRHPCATHHYELHSHPRKAHTVSLVPISAHLVGYGMTDRRVPRRCCMLDDAAMKAYSHADLAGINISTPQYWVGREPYLATLRANATEIPKIPGGQSNCYAA